MNNVYVSLGGSCAVTYHLREAGLAANTYPFDWTKLKITILNKILEAKFADYSQVEIQKWSPLHPACEMLEDIKDHEGSYVLTNQFGVKFAHEILEKYQVKDFSAKLEERIQRFNQLLLRNESDKIIFIRFEDGKVGKNYGKEIIQLLKT